MADTVLDARVGWPPYRTEAQVREEIQRTLTTLVEPGTVVEVRIPKARFGTISGYYDAGHLDQLAYDAAKLDGTVPGFYFTINPCHPDLLARSVNHLKQRAEYTTSDTDILRLVRLLIDLDPVRRAGISSTDEEHEAALARAREVRDWLVGLGWPRPILADSGNGAHLLPRIDLPNDRDATTLLRRCLQALDLEFSDDIIKVDTATFNAARLTKLYGTLVMKGDPTAERPYRYARLVEVP